MRWSRMMKPIMTETEVMAVEVFVVFTTSCTVWQNETETNGRGGGFGWEEWLVKFCIDTKRVRKASTVFLSVSGQFTNHPILQRNETQQRVLSNTYKAWLLWFVCSINPFYIVFQSSDPLDRTDLPGIVFRLSSLTITKALIRPDSPSSKSSDGALAHLWCISLYAVGKIFVVFGLSLVAAGLPKSILAVD